MSGQTWLDRHGKKRRKNKRPKHRGGTQIDRFYSSYEWLGLRAQVLHHYGRECMLCGTTSGQMNVDHIKPKKLYPELKLEFSNMQVLCAACNKGKANRTMDVRPGVDRIIPSEGQSLAPNNYGKHRLVSGGYEKTVTICRMLKCEKLPADHTGYCEEHKSEIRTGKPPGTKGSAPVLIRRAAKLT